MWHSTNKCTLKSIFYVKVRTQNTYVEQLLHLIFSASISRSELQVQSITDWHWNNFKRVTNAHTYPLPNILYSDLPPRPAGTWSTAGKLTFMYSFSRNCRSIVKVYKSLTDTWMWKLGPGPCNAFSENICFQFSVLLLCSEEHAMHLRLFTRLREHRLLINAYRRHRLLGDFQLCLWFQYFAYFSILVPPSSQTLCDSINIF
jgi:hypothetical protein